MIHSLVNQNYNIAQAEKFGLLEMVIPHHWARVDLLNKDWFTWDPTKDIPMNHIRNYFGEECGLYFCWTDHFRKWLIAPAIIGILCTFAAAIFGKSPWAEGLREKMDSTMKDMKLKDHQTDATA